MYAGHFAAGLAIKTAEPRVPMAALMGLAFLPDLVWLGLSAVGVELVGPGMWFDGWSHSITSIVVQAAFVAMLSWRCGAGTAAALSCAVLSHLLLDLPMHPAPLEWYPHAGSGFGDFLHGWAKRAGPLGKTRGWWVETAAVICILAVYLARAHRTGVSAATAGAGVILTASLQLAFG